MQSSRIIKVVVLCCVLGLVACKAPPTAMPVPTEPPPPTVVPKPTEPPPPTVVPEPEPVTIVWRELAHPLLTKASGPIIAAFQEQYPWITVKYEPTPGQGYNEAILAAFAAGGGPDVFWYDNVVQAVDRGVAEELTPYIEGPDALDLGLLYPPFRGKMGGAFAGKRYVLSTGAAGFVIFYNQDLFDAAGVPYPEEGWTWDDFLAKATALTRKDESGQQVYGASISTSINHWQHWVYANGGSICSDEGEYAGYLDSPETIEALRFFTDLYLVHEVAPSIDAMATAGGGGWRTMPIFKTGTVGMIGENSTFVAELMAGVPFKWGVVGYPVAKEGDLGVASNVGAINRLLSSQSEHKREAWLLMRFIVGAEGTTIYAQTGFPPTMPSVAEQTGFDKIPVFQVLMKQMGLPQIPLWPELDLQIAAASPILDQDLIIEILQGKRSVEEIVKDDIAQIEAARAAQ